MSSAWRRKSDVVVVRTVVSAQLARSRDLSGDPPLLSLHHALSASRDDNSTASIGQVVVILLGLGHRAREDKAADLQVKLVRIGQEVNGAQRLVLTG